MEPTITSNSYIISLIFPYIIRTPDTWPFTSIPIKPYTFIGPLKPKHGDIMVFDSPINPVSHPINKMTFVKRILAVPGDTIYFDGVRFQLDDLNNKSKKIIVPYKGMKLNFDSESNSPWRIIIERDVKKRLQEEYKIDSHIFNQNFYFFIGDNPSGSDSRSWGLVPESNLRGKVIFIFNKKLTQ